MRRTFICSVSRTPCSVGPDGCGFCIGVPCRWPRSTREAVEELERQAEKNALARIRLLSPSDFLNAQMVCAGWNANGIAQQRRMPLSVVLVSLRRVRSTLGLENSKQIKRYASLVEAIAWERKS